VKQTFAAPVDARLGVAAGVLLALPGLTDAAAGAAPCATKLEIAPPSGTTWRTFQYPFTVSFTLSGGSGHYYWQDYNEPPPGLSASFVPRENGQALQHLPHLDRGRAEGHRDGLQPSSR